MCVVFFFFNDTATTEIYTLSLHDALPISRAWQAAMAAWSAYGPRAPASCSRSEEHTSELQSQSNLVCRLLLEKKKNSGLTSTHPGQPQRHRGMNGHRRAPAKSRDALQSAR